jgi:hypothetical protein
MNLIGGLGLKKFVSIEESPAVESRSRCDTTTGDDNELFWTEKFIVLGGVNSRRAHVRFTPRKRTSSDTTGMSALCQKRTHAPQQIASYSGGWRFWDGHAYLDVTHSCQAIREHFSSALNFCCSEIRCSTPHILCTDNRSLKCLLTRRFIPL